MPLLSSTITELSSTLALGSGVHVSIVGGGGKTTTLFALGGSLPGRTVMTTTTRMGSERDGGYPVVLDPTDPDLRRALDSHDRALVWRDRTGHKAVGVDAEDCDRWFGDKAIDNVVIEADGSRQRPFKAPLAYEPVVPSTTTHLLACIGVDALGARIEDGCHRVHAVAALAGCTTHDRLTPERAARVLRHPRGSMKGRPAEAEFAVLVQRVTDEHVPLVEELARYLTDIPVVAVAPNR